MDDKEQTPFRIGGYYRNGHGSLCKIASAGDFANTGIAVLADDGTGLFGYWSLSTGKWSHVATQPGGMDLIPGELDEYGNPLPTFTATLDRPAPTPKVKAALDLLEQGFAAQSKTPTLDKLEADKKSLLDQLRDLVEAQGRDGNWNHNDYMCGMFNGMELALAIMEGREPQYRTLKPVAIAESTAKPAFGCSFASPDLSPSGHLVKADHALAAVRQLVR